MWNPRIDKTLINEFRLKTGTTFITFRSKNVDKSLRKNIQDHSELIRDVSPIIKKKYYESTIRIISEEEKNKMLDGKGEHALCPFPINFYGAYYGRQAICTAFEWLLQTLEKRHKRRPVFLNELEPYFKDFSTGFYSGYENFNQDCVNTFLIDPTDKKEIVKKTGEYVIDKANRLFIDAFSMINSFDNGFARIYKAFSDGENHGRLYKAWSMIFSNNDLFTDYFERLENKKLPTKTAIPHPGKFNDYTHGLFEYIIKEYETTGKIKFINIWYFLKRDIDKKGNILFNFTQNQYKDFIKQEHEVEIKKFAKAYYKYKDSELPLLQNIAEAYHQQQKSI